MALAGLDEELTKKIRAARPKPRSSTQRQGSYSARELQDAASADALLVARVTSLAPLMHATRVASKSIQAAAGGLLRSTRSIASDATFHRQLEDKDPPSALATKDMIDAFKDIGHALADLASKLSTQVLAPLDALSNSLKEECVEERLKLLELDQQDVLCSRAVTDTLSKKERASSELQAIARQENRSSWFFRPQTRLEEMAAMETAVVEDLANKMDQQAAVKRSKEQCMQQFRRSLHQLDERCASHLRSVADDFSRAWLAATERIGQVAKPLRSGQSGQSGHDEAKPVWAIAARKATSQRELSGSPANLRSQDVELQEALPQPELAATPSSRPSSRTGHTRESSTGSQAREAIAASAMDSVLETGLEASVDYTSPKDALKTLSVEPMEQEEIDSESHDPCSLHLYFDEHVKKLGFEIVWEAERPCVGSVVQGGEAEKAGLVSGAVLMDMNGVSTLGKSRDELMPLLKVRPLQLHAQIPEGHVPDSP